MLGTKWVAPGKGATVASLLREVKAARGYLNEHDSEKAIEHLRTLIRVPTPRTNLALTGDYLTDYDLEQIAIAVCE